MSILKRTNVKDDKTPILGGNLDGNSKDISNVNDLTVDGNLTVHGTTVTLNTSTLDVEDNVITVNNGETGAGVTAGTAGINVDRGTSTDASFLYTESTDSWDIGSKKIQNLASPVTANDAATKGYVDASAIGVLVTHSGTGAQLDKTTTRSKEHDFRTLVAGSNVTVTQNANDISISSTDTDTTYTASTGLNLTGTAFSLDSTLSGLSDVSGTAPSTGEVLKWDGASWAPAADEDTGETNTASNLGSGANVFKQKSSADLQFRSISGGSNVTVTENSGDISIAATDTDTTYSAGSGLSLTSTTFSLNANVDDLADAVITTPATDDVLQWNGSNWVNAQIEEEGTTASNLGTTGANVFAQKTTNDLEFRKIKAGSNISITQNANDIEISSTASGNVLSVNSQTGTVVLDTDDISEGSSHLFYTDGRVDTRVGNLSIDTLSDVDTTTSAPSNGQTLTWNSTGSKWEPSSNTYYTDTDFDNRLATKDTGDLAEGTNLYYTNARADARITNAGSANWNTAYGWGDHSTAGYLTSIAANSINDTHIDWGTGANQVSTADIPEDTNLYYTDGRVDTRIGNLSINALSDVAITSVADNQFLRYDTASGNWQNETVSLYGDGDVDTHLNQSTATTNDVLSWNGSDYAWVAQSGGGSSFTGDLNGNDLTDSTSSNGKVNIDQWTSITQSVNNPSTNAWEAALKVENTNHSPNSGQTNSTIEAFKSVNSQYDSAELRLVVDDWADPTKSTGFGLAVQGNNSNRLMIQAEIKDSSSTSYYLDMASFNGGGKNSGGFFGQGITFNYGLNMTPTAEGEYHTSNLTNWTLSWGNAASGNVFSQLRGYHFNVSADTSAPVTQLKGPTDWGDLLADSNFPGFGSRNKFEFIYSFGYYSSTQTPYGEDLFPYWSGQNSHGNWSPAIFWDGGTRPSWLTYDGKTQNLTAQNTTHIWISLTFPNGPYDCLADAKLYLQ